MSIFKVLLRNNIPFFYVTKYRNAMSTVREFTTDILREIRQKYQDKTLNELCFAKMLLDLALEEGLTEEEILSEILLFMVAGHETTAHSLAWIIYAMVQDVDLQEKCHRELIRAQQQPHLETKPHATDEIAESTATRLSTLRKRGKKAKDHGEK